MYDIDVEKIIVRSGKGEFWFIRMNGYDIIKGVFGIVALLGIILFSAGVILLIVNKIKKNDAKAKRMAVYALVSVVLCAIGMIGSFATAVQQYSFDFNSLDTFQVYSDDIIDGKWNDEISNQADGKNLSPELHWEAVSGASIYYIYMIDETAENWMHWEINGIPVTKLPKGLCDDELKVVWNDKDYEVKGQYIGPYPTSGTHTYTVYVFALKDIPFEVGSTNFDGWRNDIVQLAEELNHSPYTDYDNLISYGKISAYYTAR